MNPRQYVLVVGKDGWLAVGAPFSPVTLRKFKQADKSHHNVQVIVFSGKTGLGAGELLRAYLGAHPEVGNLGGDVETFRDEETAIGYISEMVEALEWGEFSIEKPPTAEASMRVEPRPYRCVVCSNLTEISTNHTDVVWEFCKKCSWKGFGFDSKNSADPMGSGRAYRKHVFVPTVSEGAVRRRTIRQIIAEVAQIFPAAHAIGTQVCVCVDVESAWHGTIQKVSFTDSKVTYDVLPDAGGEVMQNVDSCWILPH